MPTVKKLSVGLCKKTKSEKPVGNVLQFLGGFERFFCAEIEFVLRFSIRCFAKTKYAMQPHWLYSREYFAKKQIKTALNRYYRQRQCKL